MKYKSTIDISPWGKREEKWQMTDGREVTAHSAEMLKSFVDKEGLKAWTKWDISAHEFSQIVLNWFCDEGRKCYLKFLKSWKKKKNSSGMIIFFKVQVVKIW